MLKKFINISLIALFATSCGDTLGSVKRGLTGAKANSADEFMVQKKDPLILPPDFENLPTPDETNLPEDEFKIFEKNLETSIDEDISKSSSVEQSILKKIRSK
tara:strand:- start:2509 stop:2817 length:309 start_codon:yes stop_codon:yes gene_type:complete